jgi:hypothetical protein
LLRLKKSENKREKKVIWRGKLPEQLKSGSGGTEDFNLAPKRSERSARELS